MPAALESLSDADVSMGNAETSVEVESLTVDGKNNWISCKTFD